MDTYKNLNDLKGNRIWLISLDFFEQSFQLTDNVDCYGKVYHGGVFSSKTFFETNTGTTIISGAVIGDMVITKDNEEVIGQTTNKLFSSKVVMTLNNGFEATLNSTSSWETAYTWTDNMGQLLLTFENVNPASLSILLDKPASKTPNLDILLFVGIKHIMQLKANT